VSRMVYLKIQRIHSSRGRKWKSFIEWINQKTSVQELPL